MISVDCKFPELAQKLKEICKTGTTKNCLVCFNNFHIDNKTSPEYFKKAWAYYYSNFATSESLKKIQFSNKLDYGDAYSFLFYFKPNDNREEIELKKRKISKIWNNKKVVFVINENSKILKDTECFKYVKEKEYIYGPSQDAYSEYNAILSKITKSYDTSWLIYIEMGACATVLSYELSHLGYQALDMGSYYDRIYTNYFWKL